MLKHRLLRLSMLAILLWLAITAAPSQSWSATPGFRESKGQTIYVPVYSNVFSGPRKNPFQLAAMLSIRNTDRHASFRVTMIDYYNTNGKLVRRYLEKPLTVGPLASTYVHVEEKDVSGGFGASFIVKWEADKVLNTPIIECIMIGATSGQGISFVSPGQEITE